MNFSIEHLLLQYLPMSDLCNLLILLSTNIIYNVISYTFVLKVV
jgi:hypothetical protein